MRKIFFMAFMLAAIAAYPQLSGSRFSQNADLPVVQDKYPKFANGTPYFLEEWTIGDIQLATGEVHKNVKMRLDLVENSLQYISPEGAELVATSPVKSIQFRDTINGKEYKLVYSTYIGGNTVIDPGWYQALASGTATFYKRIQKTIVEPRNYSSSNTEPSVNTNTDYFLYADWVLTRVKKIKEIPPLLKDKTDELNKYLSDKKLSGKEADYIRLVEYYNALLNPKAF